MKTLLMTLFASESSIVEEGETGHLSPVDMALTVQSTSGAHLFIDVPEDWISFEVQVQGWVPVNCSDAQDCTILKVFADPFCDSENIRFSVQRESGAFQLWQSVSCVDIPISQPNLSGERHLPFSPPRRKWK